MFWGAAIDAVDLTITVVVQTRESRCSVGESCERDSGNLQENQGGYRQLLGIRHSSRNVAIGWDHRRLNDGNKALQRALRRWLAQGAGMSSRLERTDIVGKRRRAGGHAEHGSTEHAARIRRMLSQCRRRSLSVMAWLRTIGTRIVMHAAPIACVESSSLVVRCQTASEATRGTTPRPTSLSSPWGSPARSCRRGSSCHRVVRPACRRSSR